MGGGSHSRLFLLKYLLTFNKTHSIIHFVKAKPKQQDSDIIVFSASITRGQLRRLRELAKAQDRKTSQVVREAFTDWIEKKEACH
jgi:hypothetical protein